MMPCVPSTRDDVSWPVRTARLTLRPADPGRRRRHLGLPHRPRGGQVDDPVGGRPRAVRRVVRLARVAQLTPGHRAGRRAGRRAGLRGQGRLGAGGGRPTRPSAPRPRSAGSSPRSTRARASAPRPSRRCWPSASSSSACAGCSPAASPTTKPRGGWPSGSACAARATRSATACTASTGWLDGFEYGLLADEWRAQAQLSAGGRRRAQRGIPASSVRSTRAVTTGSAGSGTSASISFARRNMVNASPEPSPQVR